MAQCATTALAGAVPRPCVRGARGRVGGLGPVPGVVSLLIPTSRPACPALRVSLTLARWYAIPHGLCVPRARSGCPSDSPRVPFACVCARAPAASAPPPPWVVWRAHLARSRHWALVGPLHLVRAPPRVLPRSLAVSQQGKWVLRLTVDLPLQATAGLRRHCVLAQISWDHQEGECWRSQTVGRRHPP